jgi:hypothetical protein
MRFKMTHLNFDTSVEFTEADAPDWLTSKNTVQGSTMDARWFWTSHVLTLKVGESVKTDFQLITRIA